VTYCVPQMDEKPVNLFAIVQHFLAFH